MRGLIGNSHPAELCCLSWGLLGAVEAQGDAQGCRAEIARVTPSALSFVSPDKVQGETLRPLSACAGGR